MPALTPAFLLLLLAGLGGWVLILFGQPVGFALVLGSDGILVGWLIRLRLAEEAPRGRVLIDILVLALLYGLEFVAAGVWLQSRLQGIVLLLGAELASSAWVVERRLFPFPPDDL